MGKGVGTRHAGESATGSSGNRFSATRSDGTIGKGRGCGGESEKPERRPRNSERVGPAPWAVLGAGPAVRECGGCGGVAAGGGACGNEEGGSRAAAVAGSSPSSAGSPRVRIPISRPVPANVCPSPFSVVSDCPHQSRYLVSLS